LTFANKNAGPVDNSVDNSMIDLKRSLSFWACRIDKCLGYVIEYKHTERKKKQMTTYAKNLIKSSVLSLALVATVISLDVFRKSGNTMETAFASLAETVVGIFGVVALVFTIVYLFVGDDK